MFNSQVEKNIEYRTLNIEFRRVGGSMICLMGRGLL
jgi:hypothetical protein